MKSLKMTFVVMMLMSSSAALAQRDIPTHKIFEAYSETFKNSDVDAIVSLYSDDATIRNLDGAVVSGKANIKKLYTDFLKNGKFTIKLIVVDEERLAKNLVFTSIKFELVQLDDNNNTTEGEAINIMKKKKKEWKIYKSYRWITPMNEL